MRASKARGAAYAAALATLGLIAAACGSSSSGATAPTAVVTPAAGGAASALRTESTSIGTVTADSRGRTIYVLVDDPASNSKCSASCESIWPPVMSNGKIMTLHGHPLFTFTGDNATGQTHGQDLRDTWGKWLALNSDGAPITSASPTATAPASSGGGYGY